MCEQLFGYFVDGNLLRLIVGKRGRQFGDAVIQDLDLLVVMLQEAFHHLGFGDLLSHAGGVFVENDLTACDAIFLGVFIEFFLGLIRQGLASEEEFEFGRFG